MIIEVDPVRGDPAGLVAGRRAGPGGSWSPWPSACAAAISGAAANTTSPRA